MILKKEVSEIFNVVGFKTVYSLRPVPDLDDNFSGGYSES